ncbi:MAG TPA: hypothetical protein VLH94_02375 [Spirochaetia bacterium]|nr:hypothetical protein [Spirochaetia bacterium]
MNKLSVEDCQKLSILFLESSSRAQSPIEVNNQLIELTWSKCNYGGERVWFLCPACNKRIGTLYRKPLSDIFLCRHCLNLTYNLRKYHRAPQEAAIKAVNRMRKAESAPHGTFEATKL